MWNWFPPWPFRGILGGAAGLLILVLVIFAVKDVLQSKLKDTEKLIWILLIVFLNVLGVILYFVFAKKMSGKMKQGKRLLRSKKNRMIAGICGGIAEYFEVDPTLVRLLWVVFTLVGGAGLLAYIIAWIIVPEK